MFNAVYTQHNREHTLRNNNKKEAKKNDSSKLMIKNKTLRRNKIKFNLI